MTRRLTCHREGFRCGAGAPGAPVRPPSAFPHSPSVPHAEISRHESGQLRRSGGNLAGSHAALRSNPSLPQRGLNIGRPAPAAEALPGRESDSSRTVRTTPSGGPLATAQRIRSKHMNDTWTDTPADEAEEEAARALQTALDRRAD
ncbi:hypothetical protein GCM10009735_67870 [Actinomadura chokoriensis]